MKELIKKFKPEIKQYKNPYFSTIEFFNFLIQNKVLNNATKSQKICDIGCGIGSNIDYFSKKLTNDKFIGIDRDKEKILLAKKINHKHNNKEFFIKDIIND